MDEIVCEYESFCAENAWQAKSKAQVERGIGPLMMEMLRIPKHNDIQRGSTMRRGYMGVRFISPENLPASQP